MGAERESVEVRSLAELRAWLAAHHERTDSVCLVHHKKHSPHHVSWGQLVREALCFGWIDGQVKTVDADRVMHLLSPRRAGSPWSAINKVHVAELEAEGRMQSAGWAAIERAKADGSWEWLDDVENLLEPADLRAGLAADPAARTGWDAYPLSEKKGALRKLKDSKREETRARWLGKVLANAAEGKRTFT